MRRRAVLLLTVITVALLAVASPAWADTFTVNVTGDENDLDFPGGTFDGSSDGKCFVGGLPATGDECTLRAAIQAANKLAGADTIAFAIPGNGPHTISPGESLPEITKPVTIDGYTQGDATPFTSDDAKENTITQPDLTNAAPTIELNGISAGPTTGLQIGNTSTPAPNNVVIRGLVIDDFDAFGILFSGGTGHKVEGNFIGTGPSGTSAEGSGFGVVFSNTDGSTIGGTSREARNLISGNVFEGVVVTEGSSGNKVEGNLIGVNKIGGPLGNGRDGVIIQSSSSTGNSILSNSIFSNGLLGIDLSGGTTGVTANDEDDPNTPKPDPDKDIGPNNFQNFPVLSSAEISLMGNTIIKGELESTPSTRKKKRTFIIQFFSNPEKDSSGFGEGKTFLGQMEVKTDREGKAPISFFTQAVSEGEFITATATNKKTGDTSEFSEARVVEGPVIGGGG